MKAKTDRLDNIIGDGTYHVDYDVFDFSKIGYDFIKSHISKSETTESVYVYYDNTINNRTACVRFSMHTSNSVRFGDVLEFTNKDEILYRLGLKTKKIVDDFKSRLFIATRQVKKDEACNYEEAELTIQEMYALGDGADLSMYLGKRAKGSRYLILGECVKEITTKIGSHYEYE